MSTSLAVLQAHPLDDVGDLDVEGIFGDIARGIGKAAKGVGKGIAAGARGAAKGASVVGSALHRIPVAGGLLGGAFNLAVGSPFAMAASIVSGARIDKAVLNHLKSQLANIKEVAPYVQTVLSFIPGVGQGISGAIAGALALASGAKLTDALLEATKGALPGGKLSQMAFDVGKAAIQGKAIDEIALQALPISAQQKQMLKQGLAAAKDIAHGKNVGSALLDNALKALPADAQKAIQIGMALGHGQVLQAVQTAATLNAVQKAGAQAVGAGAKVLGNTAVVRQVVNVANQGQKQMNILGKGGRDILQDAKRVLGSTPVRAPISIVSGEVQRAMNHLRANPGLASLPLSQLAHRAGVSPATAQRALSMGKFGVPWKPLNNQATNLVRRMSPFASVRALTDTRGLSPDGLVYVVERGDYPGKIAKLLTGKENLWPALIAANPQKPTVTSSIGKVFKTLVAGEKLKVPPSWHVVSSTANAPPPGAAPPADAPAVIVNDPARANTAAVLQSKALLVTWSKTDGAKTAGFQDYGTRPEDLSAQYGERDKFMGASFEIWSNANRGTNLPTDGLLNDALASELRRWAEARTSLPLPAPPPAAEEPPPVVMGQPSSPAPSAPAPVVLPTLPGLPPIAVTLPTMPLPTLPSTPSASGAPPIELPDMTIPGSSAPAPAGEDGLMAALAGALTGGFIAGPIGAIVGGGLGLFVGGGEV